MKILCVADSLGLPRNGVSYESTWFYKLSRLYGNKIDLIPKFQRSLTSNDICIPDYSSFYNPNIVVMQIGICDCAPRLYRRKRLFRIVLERVFRGYFFLIIKKVRTRSPKRADVSFEDFSKNINRYYNLLKKNSDFKLLVIILIGASNNENFKKKSPHFYDNIKKYNTSLSSYKNYDDCIVIDPLGGLPEEYFVEDGYHLNHLGNAVVFNELKKIIDKYV